MNSDPQRLRRRRAISRQVERLERRLARLEAQNRRFSWYRLASLLAGAALIWLAAFVLPEFWAWLAFIGSPLVFFSIVALHRRLDGWRQRFSHLTAFRRQQLARLDLDWPNIPAALPSPSEPRSSLEIDLDLTGPNSLHQLLNVAITPEGARRLAAWLSAGQADLEAIPRRQQVVSELASLTRLRTRLLLAFREVAGGLLDGEALVGWLAAPVPHRRLARLLLISTSMAVANATLFVLNATGRLPAYWLGSLVLYLLWYYTSLPQLREFLDALVRLEGELDKFRALLQPLERFDYRGHPGLAELCQPFFAATPTPTARLRRLKLASAGVGLRMNPVLGSLVNLVLPWDFTFAVLAARLQARLGDVLPGWLAVWYDLEALLSLANFAVLNPGYAFPKIGNHAGPVFEAQGLGHPLLPPDTRVCNDFTVDQIGQVVVITGANMAGKSTFIKTVGINLCLAYAGGPVDATSLRAAPFRLHTCIRISDSLTGGYSYFYAEVRCLRRLLEGLRDDQAIPLLFLIDEIFRGTNNRERLIGSRAFVRSLLGENGVGFIATHDLELAGLAGEAEEVQNFHFRDHVQDGRLAFDYLIHSGPSTTTNALKIMAMEGLPVNDLE